MYDFIIVKMMTSLELRIRGEIYSDNGTLKIIISLPSFEMATGAIGRGIRDQQ